MNNQRGFNDFEDHQDELVPEDWPTFYTPVPVWVLLSGCSAQAYRMYAFLAEHINNRVPGKRIACPKQVAIARVMGLKDDRKVARYRRELEELGAIRVEEYRYGGGMRRGYRYVVRFNPPAGYEGLLSLQAFYAANPDVKSAKTEGRTKTATSPSPSPVPAQAAAPAEESGPERAADGGDQGAGAARKPGKKKAKKSGEVALPPQVLQVLAAFPQPLREAMRETAHTDSPKTLVSAVQKQLRERTAEQLVDRVCRRWWAHGYEAKFEAGRLERPVGAAVAMLRHGKCPDARCEDGEVLDTGEPCVLCIERGKDYKADRAQERQRKQDAAAAAARRRRCPGCERDRGTDGAACKTCITWRQTEVDKAVETAAAEAERMIRLGDTTLTPDEARTTARARAEEARLQAKRDGIHVLEQLETARLGAEVFVREVRQFRTEIEATQRGAEQAELPEQAPAAAPERETAPCGGSRWDSSPCGRTTDSEDGLCGLCRAAQRIQTEDLATTR